MSRQFANDLRDLEYRLTRLDGVLAAHEVNVRAAEEDATNDERSPAGSGGGSPILVACTGCGLPVQGAVVQAVDSIFGFVADQEVSDVTGLAALTVPGIPGVGYYTFGLAAGYVMLPFADGTMPVDAGSGTVAMAFGPSGGYAQAPAVLLTPTAGGSGAVAYCTMGGTSGQYVAGVTITNKGSGYGSPPAVSFSDNGIGDVGAIATAFTGRVDSVTVTAHGSGYGSGTTVVFSPPPGGGITATGTVTTSGGIYTITLTNGGAGYTSPPTITFGGSSGSGAAATANMVYGQVEAIVLTNNAYNAACIPGYGVTRPRTLSCQFGSATITPGGHVNALASPVAYYYFPPFAASGTVYPPGSGTYPVGFILNADGTLTCWSTRTSTGGTPEPFSATLAAGQFPTNSYGTVAITVDSWAPFSGHADFTGTAADGPIFQTGSKVVNINGYL